MSTTIVDDVFLSAGVPTATYVKQEHGAFEKSLAKGIRRRGKICLVSGLSKSGKTTLWNTVLKNRSLIPIVVNCTAGMSAKDFWRVPLERLDFDQLKDASVSKTKTKTGGVEGALELNWLWLAKKTGKLSGTLSSATTNNEVRTRILAEPSPAHLIPLLYETNAILVIEDFHYLANDTKTIIMQSWKSFVDKPISLIVVETVGAEAELVKANQDMTGRVQSINLKRWKVDDLLQIAKLGLEQMGLPYTEEPFYFIAEESVGLPIVMQQVCAQLFADREIDEVRSGEQIRFRGTEATKALHDVAVSEYDIFNEAFDLVCAQPANGNRPSKLQCILEPFYEKAPEFTVAQSVIAEYVEETYQLPDRTSAEVIVRDVLEEIVKYQTRIGVRIINWKQDEEIVEIVESTFLLYVRWGKPERT